MKKLLQIAVFGIGLFFSMQIAAKIWYRHIPFQLSLSPREEIIVNYHLSEIKRISCESKNKNLMIYFEYKGQQKRGTIPAILQQVNIPQYKNEYLANETGQFKINLANERAKSAVIFCHYIE